MPLTDSWEMAAATNGTPWKRHHFRGVRVLGVGSGAGRLGRD
jgi:hypothetical protein